MFDVHTAPTDAGGNKRGWVLHAATGRPMLMVFTVPDCGGVKSYVGPISSFHSVLTEQHHRRVDHRYHRYHRCVGHRSGADHQHRHGGGHGRAGRGL